jgi:Matrixin
MRPRFALALGILMAAPAAHAFCRTTTCSPTVQARLCTFANGCVRGGLPLAWPSSCVSFSIQEDGSKQRDITAAQTDTVVRAAFEAWMNADCGNGQHPSITLIDKGTVSCNEQQYNQYKPNANIWMYRDGSWPYPNSIDTLALTTITFNIDNGDIYDADVELNSADGDLTLPNQKVVDDLQSIATHEAGHFLGMAHTLDTEATMYASYTPETTRIRQLSQDDIAGICAVYPPGKQASCSPTPRHGYSTTCQVDTPPSSGCTLSQPSPDERRAPKALFGIFVALGVTLTRRRATRRRRSRT